MTDIRYYRHKDIDLLKWDKAIDKSYNGLIYAYSFMLNNMAGKRWDALIMGDYEAVFPLAWNRKFGFAYLYQPYLCQQLGLFSSDKISTELLQEFMEAIPRRFRYWKFHLNAHNLFFHPKMSFVNRTTYQISLQHHYTDIYDHYNADAKKNLAKSALAGFDVRKDIEVNLVVECFKKAYGSFYPNDDRLFQRIVACEKDAIRLQKGFTRGIYGRDGILWCAGFFFIARGMIHYAMAAPTEEGKKYGATHILIDEVLKEFANTDLIFDFEGSDIQSVAYFYSKFGSKPVYYLEITNNRLPWWCRFLKRK
jgi:hypothetical protein